MTGKGHDCCIDCFCCSQFALCGSSVERLLTVTTVTVTVCSFRELLRVSRSFRAVRLPA